MVFDPLDPATRACPYHAYRELRETAPIWRHPAAQIWFVSGHGEAAAVLRDPHFSARQGQTLRRGAQGLPLTMLSCDPPEHTRLRSAVAREFGPHRVTRLEPGIRATATDIVAAWRDGETVDAVLEYAHPVVADSLCALLGIAPADRDRLRRWALEVAPQLDPLDPPTPQSRASAALDEMLDWFADLLGDRLGTPTDDVLGALTGSYEADQISGDEARNTCGLLVIGGFEPLVDLITMCVWLVLRERATSPGLTEARMSTIVEEALRYESPIHFAARVPVEDAEVGGTTVRAGEPVVVLVGAANRDPARFADPERFDHRRRPNPHLAFGAGVHGCLGAAFSRVVARVAVRAVIDGAPSATVAGEPTWRESFVPRGLATLPIHVAR